MPNTYTIAQEATNIAKEELIVGGHIGNVALAATCDLANGVEQSFRSFIELQKREGIMPDDTRITFHSDVSVAMENFKNNLLSAHMVQQDGSYGPVAPGSSLVSSRAHLDAIDAIPTACSQLDGQPQNLSVMVESATEAKHQAAAVALMTHNSASSTETVTTTNPINLGDIHTNPIRAEM